MRIEAAFSSLLVRGTDARFDTSELLRADIAARFAAYSVALAGAAFMRDDKVRALEGLGPMAGPPADSSAPTPAPFVEVTD